jgi:hypothetical protein
MSLRNRTTRWRIPITAGVAATTLAASAVIAAPTASATVNLPPCPATYVCLATSPTGPYLLVPEGTEVSFAGGLVVYRLANRTHRSYCVTGEQRFALQIGVEITRTERVYAVEPGYFCSY